MNNLLALLADWANGVFAVVLASWVTGTEILWWHLLIGIVVSHVPDIDALPELLRRGRISASAEDGHDHRTFLHYPLLSLPLAICTVWWFGYWGWIFLFALILHLANDLYGTGWGIPVLWPFSKRHYKVLSRRANRLHSLLVDSGDWQQLPVNERRLRFVVSWSETELPVFIRRWGVDKWIPLWYGRLNWVSGVEYGLFIIACILAYLSLTS